VLAPHQAKGKGEKRNDFQYSFLSERGGGGHPLFKIKKEKRGGGVSRCAVGGRKKGTEFHRPYNVSGKKKRVLLHKRKGGFGADRLTDGGRGGGEREKTQTGRSQEKGKKKKRRVPPGFFLKER